MNRSEIAALLGVPESELDQVLSDLFSSYPEATKALAPQMDRAQAMADQPMREGQMVGRFFVPRSPLASLADAAGRGMGAYQLAKLQGEQGSLLDALRRGRQSGGIAAMKQDLDQARIIEELIKAMQGEPVPEQPEVPEFLRRPEEF